MRVRHEFVEQAALLIGDLREVRVAWASMKRAPTKEHELVHLTIDCDGNTRKVDWLLVRAQNSFDPTATIARSGLPPVEISELPNEDPSSRQVRLWTVQTPTGLSLQYLKALLAAKDALWGERQDSAVAVPTS